MYFYAFNFQTINKDDDLFTYLRDGEFIWQAIVFHLDGKRRVDRNAKGINEILIMGWKLENLPKRKVRVTTD